MDDTLLAGRGLSNWRAAAILTESAPRCIRELEELGVTFDRNGACFDLGREGGHSHRRNVHAGGTATGASLVRALVQRVQESDHIKVFERTAACDLLSDGTRCFGAVTYDQATRGHRLWSASATILATGGAAGLYWRTTNPSTAAGEGVALAYDAGAELMDMEFIQFHPTALCSNGRSLLISEAVRGEGAQLLNRAGRRFMSAYHPLAELASRDVVARAIDQEMRDSGGGFVLLSLRHLKPDFIKQRFANIYQDCLAQGVDITRDLIPVAPAAHYSLGGVWTDLAGRTSLAGLWACGEVAASGLHGANRLASNSLLECLVFAGRAEEDALGRGVTPARFPEAAAKKVPTMPVNGDIDAAPLVRMMTAGVGLVRSGARLAEAREGIKQLWQQDSGHSLSWRNRLLVAQLIAEAAQLRTETRGVHVREDFPTESPNWRKHIILKKGAEPRCICP